MKEPEKKSRLLVGVIFLLCLLAGSLAACRGGGEEALPDGIYCAPAPGFMETDWETDPERWEFTLMKYDPESGERGAVLDTVVLPLAEDLMLQWLNWESPISAGEAGTSTRQRRIVDFMFSPMVRSTITPRNYLDMLEVHIQNGEVTYLKWFWASTAEGAEGKDVNIYGEDVNIYTVTGGIIHTFTGEAAGGTE